MKTKLFAILMSALFIVTSLSSCRTSSNTPGSSDNLPVSSNISQEKEESSLNIQSEISTSSEAQGQTSDPKEPLKENNSSDKNNTSSKKNNYSNNTTSKKEDNSSTNPPAVQLPSTSSSSVSSEKESTSSAVSSAPSVKVPLKAISPDEYYGWKQLKAKATKAEQKAYQLFVETFGKYKSTVEFDFDITNEQVENAYNHYRDDYPQHFWLGTASYRSVGENIISLTISNNAFGSDAESIRKREKEMLQKAQAILSKVDGSMKPIEREHIIHDSLVNSIKYDTTLKEKNAHSLYGALVEGDAVCEGYSKAFQYLMREAGVQCIVVKGGFNGDSHEWNMVEIDGKFYHIDVTADDPISNNKRENLLKFDYFNLTESEIKRDHIISGNVYSIPKADNSKYNFFNYYGLKAKKLDTASFAKSMVFSVNNGYSYAHILLENVSMDDAMDYVVPNYKNIVDAANKTLGYKKIVMGKTISYSQNTRKNILSIKLDF